MSSPKSEFGELSNTSNKLFPERLSLVAFPVFLRGFCQPEHWWLTQAHFSSSVVNSQVYSELSKKKMREVVFSVTFVYHLLSLPGFFSTLPLSPLPPLSVLILPRGRKTCNCPLLNWNIFAEYIVHAMLDYLHNPLKLCQVLLVLKIPFSDFIS